MGGGEFCAGKTARQKCEHSTGDGGRVRWSNDWTYDEESRETRLKTWWIVTGNIVELGFSS